MLRSPAWNASSSPFRSLLASGFWGWLAVVLVGFAAEANAAADAAKLRVLIIDGRNNHEWEKTTPAVTKMLEATGRFTVDVHTAPPAESMGDRNWPVELTAEDLRPYDCVISNYNGPAWSPETEQAINQFVAGGKGMVAIHAANNCHRGWEAFQQMLGYNWRNSAHGPKFEFDVNLTDLDHPITEGMQDFWHSVDELYHLLKLNPDATNVRVLATSFSPPRMLRLKRTRDDGTEYVIDHCFGTGNEEPVVVITDFGKGRCFHMILGHYARSMEDNGFKTLMARGTEWAASGEVTLPVIAPLPPARNLPRYPQPQVVVEGLEQHLIREEHGRLTELFADDGKADVQAMVAAAVENSEAIRRLIRELRIPRVPWKIEGQNAVWRRPESASSDRWYEIECVKRGEDWQIRAIR